jgi:hypothetical protein
VGAGPALSEPAAPARPWLDYGLLVAALAAGGGAVWALRQDGDAAAVGAWWTLAGAGALGGWALRRTERWLPSHGTPPQPAVWPPRGRRIAGGLAVAAAVALVAWVVWRLWPEYRRWEGTFVPWMAALVLTAVGGWLLGGRSAGPATAERAARRIPRVWEAAAFLAIAALAVALRVHRIGEIPPGIYVDETNAALDALHILEGRRDSPFGTGWYETPSLYIHYMAVLFRTFGVDHASLKAASLIPAILTVLAVYPLGRLLFGPLAGLCAMLLTAVSRWHLTMSRWGWNETAPPLFQVLATFFLLRGLRDGRRLDFAMAGLLSGLMTYTYLSSRLALATLAAFVVYRLLVEPGGPAAGIRRHGGGLLLFGAATLVAAAPLALTYVREPFTFWNRMRELSVFNEVRETGSYAPLVDNVGRHLRFFHQAGDAHGKHNLPGEPETDPVTGGLFVLGLGHALFRPRDPRRALLVLWLVLAMAGGVLSVRHEAPQAYRTLGAVPAIALLAGDVLARLARATLAAGNPTRRPLIRKAVAAAVLAAGLGGAALWEAGVYFGRQARSTAVQASFNPMENRVADEVLRALRDGTAVYVSPRFYDFSPLRFLVYGAVKRATGRNTLEDRPYALMRPEVDLPVPDRGTGALFLLDSAYGGLSDHVLFYYPRARIRMARGPGNEDIYLRVEVDREQVAALQGLAVRGAGQPAVLRDVERVDLSGGTVAVGGLRVPRSGPYDLVATDALSVRVDGTDWTGPRFLARGLHALELAARRSGGGGLRWQTPGGAAETIPADALFRTGPPAQGLDAAYFMNTDWSGDPLFRQRIPFLLTAWNDGDPIAGPFSARFSGRLKVDAGGAYGLRVEADDGARLVLDGALVAEGLVPNRPNTLRAEVSLAAGEHPLVIDYVQLGGGSALELYWRPPGGQEVPIPPQALLPPAP